MDGTLACETYYTYYDTMMFIEYCLYDHPEQICSKRWYKVEAKVIERFTSLYGRKGPVLVVKSIKPSSEPEEPVATFY